MRTSTENLQPTQDASVADVQPTKQAIDPSTEEIRGTIIQPSSAALSGDTYISYDRLWERNLRNAKFSDAPETYDVRIEGSESSGGGRDYLSVETIHRTYHPYLAIGEAVFNFIMRTGQGSRRINDISIFKCVTKTRKSKK